MGKSIGVYTVATNHYFNYWTRMIESADKSTDIKDQVTFIVFTDAAPEEIEKVQKKLKNVGIDYVSIQNLTWPMATLMRFELIHDILSIKSYDIVMHLDADMLFVRSPWKKIKGSASLGMNFVRHPGYFRPNGLQLLYFYIGNPKSFGRDLRLFVLNGGIGNWEKRKKYPGFISRSKRKVYLCGATWFSTLEFVGPFLSQMADAVRACVGANLVPIFHDESLLNKWAVENIYVSNDPDYCFDPKASYKKGLDPFIIAVDKSL